MANFKYDKSGKRIMKYNDRKTIVLQSKLPEVTLDGVYALRERMHISWVDLYGKNVPSIRIRNQVYNFASKEYSKTQKAEMIILMYLPGRLARILAKPGTNYTEGRRLLRSFVRTTYAGQGNYERTLHEMILKDFSISEFASNQIEETWFDKDTNTVDKSLQDIQEAFNAIY